MIRWGILGAGSVAHDFADGLRHARDAELHAVAGRSRERVAALAGAHGAQPRESFDALLGDPSVDVVYIGTPNALHVEQTLAALAAGKPVLCEKPLAPTAAEAERIAAATADAGVFCAEAMWTRCSDAFRQVVREVRGGAIGEVRSVDAHLGFGHPPSVVSKVLAPDAGGALLDLGVYPLTLVQAVAGPAVSASARARRDAGGVDEAVAAVLSLEGGATATVGADVAAELANAATITGTEGIIHIPDSLTFPLRRTLRTYARAEPGDPAAAAGGVRGLLHRPALKPRLQRVAGGLRTVRATDTHLPHGTGYTAEAEEVGRCLREGRTESDDLRLADTIEVLRSVDLIREAMA